jgi:hypothetical protein
MLKRFIKKFGIVLCLILSIVFSNYRASNAQEITPSLRQQFEKLYLSEGLDSKLGSTIGIVVRNINEEKVNLEVSKILADLSKSTILKITNYQSKIIDLSELENIWEKDMEFNNSNFEDIFGASKFEIMQVLDFRTVKDGFYISVNFYRMQGEETGSVAYTIPSSLINFNWKEFEEIEVLSASESRILNQKIQEVLNKNKVIENAITFEENYANYKILEGVGEYFEAINSLILAIKLKPYLVDLIHDVTVLSRSYFGADAQSFLNQKLYSEIDYELIKYSKLLLDPSYDIFFECDLDVKTLSDTCEILVDKIKYPQLLNLFLKTQGLSYGTHKKNSGSGEIREYILLQSARQVIRAYKDGRFSDNYFNKLRSGTDVALALALDIERTLNTAKYIPIRITNYVLGSGSSWTISELEFVGEGSGKELIFKQAPGYLASQSKPRRLTREKSDPLKFYDFSTGFFDDFRGNLQDIKKYLPPTQMHHSVASWMEFIGNTVLGPCKLSDGTFSYFKNSVGRNNYFYSEEKKSEAIKIHQDNGNQKELDRLTFVVPTVDPEIVKTINDLFRAPYLANKNNYLPNNRSNASEYQWRKHADYFFTPENDRLLWADLCIYSMMYEEKIAEPSVIPNDYSGRDGYVKLNYMEDGTPTFEFSALANLYITDEVDTSKPIFMSANPIDEFTTEWSLFDISIDGTQFDPAGVNLDTNQLLSGGDVKFNVLQPNKWLYAPGVLQSSVGVNSVKEIRYTDIYGNSKTVRPTAFHYRSTWSSFGDGVPVIDRADEFVMENSQLLGAREYFEKNLETNINFFMAMNLPLKLPPYLTKDTNEIPQFDIALFERTFSRFSPKSRRALQNGLKQMGLYKSSVDGKWGKGTRDSFKQFFKFLDSYYPNRDYIIKFGFDDGMITKQEFADFWNATYGCDSDQLLSVTSVCGN